VHPVDHVVADIHRVRALRQDLDLEGVAKADGLERLVPPAGSLQQCAADRLGRGPVDVVYDGLHRVADFRVGIFLLEAVAGDQLLLQGLVDGHGEIHVPGTAAEHGAGIPNAGLIPRSRELHEGVVLAEGYGRRVRRHLADIIARIPGREGQERLQLRVLGEILRVGQVHGRAGDIQPEVPLAGAADAVCDTVSVAHQEGREVDQHPAFLFCLDLETPDDRLREGIAHGFAFVRIFAVRPVGVIGLYEEHLGADSVELHDPAASQLAAVQADVVGPQPGRQRVHVQELLVELVDLQQDPPCPGVPVEGKVPRIGPHPRHLGPDGRGLSPGQRETQT